jgi:ABC-2 type transport system permease protein
MIRTVLSASLVQIKNTFSRNMYKVCFFVTPIISAIIAYEMLKNSGRDDFAMLAIIASSLDAFWICICFSSIGDINRERFSGTLSITYAAPKGFNLVMLGKMLGNTVLSLGSIIVATSTILVLYHPQISISNPILFILAFFVLMTTILVFSFVVAQFLTLTRKTALYMNAFAGTIVFFCAFQFPLENMPIWAKPISYCLTPTWGAKLLKMSATSVDVLEYWKTFGIGILVSAIYIVATYFLKNMIDYQVRKSGTLDMS